jgi:hypothetical protein
VRLRILVLITLALYSAGGCFAQSCYRSSITSPAPFMGNHDEIFQLADGTHWKVQFEYSYLYEYYPSIAICPSVGKLMIGGKTLNVMSIMSRPTSPMPLQGRSSTAGAITVVAYRSGCRDYFLADGPQGYYLLEWYGGYTPSVGDTIIGELGGYGMKDVYYPAARSQGRIYVDDYLLSRSRAIEKYSEKCR